MIMKKNKHRGSSFDDFLKEEGLFEECNAEAVKRVIAFQLEKELKKQKLTKTQLAKRMHTSRAAVNRILDPRKNLQPEISCYGWCCSRQATARIISLIPFMKR